MPPLFLDIQASQEATSPERGIFRYVSMHAAALARIPGAVMRFGVHPALPSPRHLPDEIAGSGRVVPLTAREFRRARAEGPFAYYVTAPFHAYRPLETGLPRFGIDGSAPLLATIYDFIPLTDREFYLRRAYDRHEYDCRLRLVAEADLLLALSRWTADETVDVLGVEPERVAVIGAGVSSAFHPTDDDATRRALVARAAPQLRGEYLLTVGFTDTRKNLELLLHAYAKLPGDLRGSLQVVYAGDLGPAYTERLTAEAEHLGLAPDALVVPGRVTEPELRALYQSAALFVFPSRAEGFGLPVVEAIACGCPAIVADSSALPEVLEWPPALFDPSDADGLAQLVERALRDSEFRAELQTVCQAAASRHTWDAVARRTVDALDRLDPVTAQPRSRRSPWRVAFAGAFDARGSGVAAANAALVHALGEHAEVDLFVPGHRAGVAAARASNLDDVPVFVIGALGTARPTDQYDGIFHSVADGPDRQAHLDALERTGGIRLTAEDLRQTGPEAVLALLARPNSA